jgi:hypothetical protein
MCRLAISEAAFNATIPTASLADISRALDTYYHMVLLAYPNRTEYQALYWSMNGYVASSAGPELPLSSRYLSQQSKGRWTPGYIAGILRHTSFSYATSQGRNLLSSSRTAHPTTHCHISLYVLVLCLDRLPTNIDAHLANFFKV